VIFHDSLLFQYRKIPNISPGLMQVCKHILMGLFSGKGLIFGGSFGLAGDLCMPENSPFSVQSERRITTFNA